MTKQTNKLKDNDLKPSGKRSRRRKKSVKRAASPERMIKIRKISGFFLILLSFYLLFAFISYFFTWWIDYDKIAGLAMPDLSGNVEISNWTGFIGAYLSNLFIKDGFGVSSFLFSLILFVAGMKLALDIRLFSFSKTLIYSLVFIFWLSLFFGFFFRDTSLAIMGGVFGYEISSWSEGVLGWVGTAIILIFIFLCVLIIAFNLPGFFTIKKRSNRDTEDEENNGNILKPADREDKYNTVEFSVSEDEGLNDSEENETEDNPEKQDIKSKTTEASRKMQKSRNRKPEILS
ncbi:MAG: DNA translocase FtsK 4TM domain-containing protein [Bacteroidota bacterium]|nr:DNA translocase FtsK 4TM domain-containing protein [Bacteroidota bacterium]